MTKQSKRSSPAIAPSLVRYVKLGWKGEWEKECLQKGIIRIGFGSARLDRAAFFEAHDNDWNRLAKSFVKEGKSKSVATRFANECRIFVEDEGSTLWLTFMNDCLYWGFLTDAPPKQHTDGAGVYRKLRGGWRCTDIKGSRLSKDKLSGALTKLAAFRGTSCKVDVEEYAVRRINGQKLPVVERALTATKEMSASVVGLMQLLVPKDFELLVDLVFTTSGWRRIGVVGKTQKTLDIDMVLPSTSERAFVQVKSQTSSAQLARYLDEFGERAELYQRMFYVYHSGEAQIPDGFDDLRVTLIGPEQLAEMVINAGLVSWLVEKVS